MSAFYVEEGGLFRATVATRGPWDERFQHGGPPAALLVRAVERAVAAADFQVARLAFDLLRPVPIGPVRVRAELVARGRTVQRWVAVLSAGEHEVVRLAAVCIRRAPGPRGGPGATPWPAPGDCAPLELSFFPWEEGYHRAVVLRRVHGTWGATPIGLWARLGVSLVAGEATSPLQALVALADAQSGMGVPLDPRRWSFVNPDLTVVLERPPVGSWFGFDVRSAASGTGMGAARSEVRDEDGVVAGAAQTLVVAARRGRAAGQRARGA